MERGKCLQTDIKMSREAMNYIVRLGGWDFWIACSHILWHSTSMGFTMCGQLTWTKSHCQAHNHSWLTPLSVMEGKWSGGRLLAAPSQMAAGTLLRLADNQRTSKLRRVLKPISVQSQGAKGREQKGDCNRQELEQSKESTGMEMNSFSLFLYLLLVWYSFTYTV